MKQLPPLLAAALLVVAFLALCGWFHTADVYDRHFFNAGLIGLAYNLARILFLGFFALIVCSLGYAILLGSRAVDGLSSLTAVEKAVVAFGTGIGALHVIMLALGVGGLYYTPIMLAICVVLLAVASPLVVRWLRRLAARRARGLSPTTIATVTALAISAVWLLIVKGLYPGGGGDYYTHYFYYYLQVLHNHGLRPNDVWYHYYYSKGAGPTFLGMLLTDPEAPEIVTYCCVLFAAIAVTTLSVRLAPRSLWPALAGSLYLLSYIVPLSDAVGGEFQKPHEETSALIVLAAWGLCMRRIGPPEVERASLIMTAAALAAAAALELAASVLFGAFLGLAAVWTFIRRDRREAQRYAVLAVYTVVITGAVLLLNYEVTGLATDQALKLMLRFANVEKLNALGLIPQIILVAWIRDNYALLAADSIGWSQIVELRDFLRLDYLWILIIGGFIALGLRPRPLSAPNAGVQVKPGGMTGTEVLLVLLLVGAAAFFARATLFAFQVADVDVPTLAVILVTVGAVLFALPQFRRGSITEQRAQTDIALRSSLSTLKFLGALVVTLAVVSVPAAGSQTVSYLRFSGFFVPLVILIATACWGIGIAAWSGDRSRRFLTIAAPASAFVLVLVSWQVSTSWFDRAGKATLAGLRFLSGNYALAQAYRHQSSGLPYGGIKLGTLAAEQHAPPGARIWSTNVDSYCMAPGCVIESSVSFKLSSRLNEILNDPPAQARAILQAEHLNYFLFSTNAINGIIDPLPYSRLFEPATLHRYFGVDWTNGKDYLLTWRSPGTKPIGSSFNRYYRAALAGYEHPWFRFRELLPQMQKTMATLEASPHPWRHLVFYWELSRRKPAHGSSKLDIPLQN